MNSTNRHQDGFQLTGLERRRMLAARANKGDLAHVVSHDDFADRAIWSVFVSTARLPFEKRAPLLDKLFRNRCARKLLCRVLVLTFKFGIFALKFHYLFFESHYLFACEENALLLDARKREISEKLSKEATGRADACDCVGFHAPNDSKQTEADKAETKK